MIARILVTDDDTATRKLYRDVLQSRGYAVREAGSGAECIELAQRDHPALIVLDLHMPVRDGFSAAADLKSNPDTRSIPILAVTGVSRALEIDRALEAGCDAVLNKPLAPKDLLDGVRGLLGRFQAEEIREHAERQRQQAAELVRRSYADLRALLAASEELGETEIRQWLQGAQVTICSFCGRIRAPNGWQSITPELLEFLQGWATLSHGICPECLAREYPDTISRG